MNADQIPVDANPPAPADPATESETLRLAQLVGRLAARNEGRVTARVLMRANQRRYNSTELARSDLQHLADLGYGAWEATPERHTGGWQPSYFIPSPHLRVTHDASDARPDDRGGGDDAEGCDTRPDGPPAPPGSENALETDGIKDEVSCVTPEQETPDETDSGDRPPEKAVTPSVAPSPTGAGVPAPVGTPKPEMGVWTREVLATLDLVRGGALRRLAQLAATPPTDPDELWAALAVVEKYLDFPQATELVNLPEFVSNRAEAVVQVARGIATGAIGALIAGLHREADRLCDEGRYGPNSPVRLSDFRGQHGTLTGTNYGGHLFGRAAALPDRHPARGLVPVPGLHPYLVLGRNAKQWPLKLVQRWTVEHAQQKRAEEEAHARQLQREADQRRRALENDPNTLRQRLAALEAQLKPRGEAPTS